MNDDLIAQLRRQEWGAYGAARQAEAADEIERLQGELTDTQNVAAQALYIDIERLRAEAVTWRDIAVALVGELVEDGYDPNSIAIRAHNHARNGRYIAARQLLERKS